MIFSLHCMKQSILERKQSNGDYFCFFTIFGSSGFLSVKFKLTSFKGAISSTALTIKFSRAFLCSCTFNSFQSKLTAANILLELRFRDSPSQFCQIFLVTLYQNILTFFFKRWPSSGQHLFDHLLWSIFQPSIHKHYKLHFFMIYSY